MLLILNFVGTFKLQKTLEKDVSLMMVKSQFSRTVQRRGVGDLSADLGINQAEIYVVEML